MSDLENTDLNSSDKQNEICNEMYEFLQNLQYRLLDGLNNFNCINNASCLGDKSKDAGLLCYYDKVTELYGLIYLISCIYRYANTLDKSYKDKLHRIFADVLDLYVSKDTSFYSDSCIKILLQDCNNIAAGMFDSLDQYSYYPEAYFGVGKINEADLYDSFRKFTSTDTYDPQNEDFMKFNAFADLYYIKEILNERKKLLPVI